jgi:hypothetical protein
MLASVLANTEGSVRPNEPRLPMLPPEDDEQLEQLSASQIAEQILRRENQQLRERMRSLEGALRCAAKTLLPYAKR